MPFSYYHIKRVSSIGIRAVLLGLFMYLMNLEKKRGNEIQRSKMCSYGSYFEYLKSRSGISTNFIQNLYALSFIEKTDLKDTKYCIKLLQILANQTVNINRSIYTNIQRRYHETCYNEHIKYLVQCPNSKTITPISFTLSAIFKEMLIYIDKTKPTTVSIELTLQLQSNFMVAIKMQQQEKIIASFCLFSEHINSLMFDHKNIRENLITVFHPDIANIILSFISVHFSFAKYINESVRPEMKRNLTKENIQNQVYNEYDRNQTIIYSIQVPKLLLQYSINEASINEYTYFNTGSNVLTCGYDYTFK